jgi:acetyl esterase/lipase
VRRAVALLAAVALAGCGTSRDPHRIVTEQVGRGAQTTFLIHPDVARRLPVVLFLHGWGATLPANYRPWLDHLAREGNVVIYPRYQESALTPPPQVLGNALAGVRLALAKAHDRPGALVVAGHSAGGALAADYAAAARSAGLPVPRAIFAAYPGRRLRRVPALVPEVAPAQIPAATRLVALGGADDRTVGTAPARRIVRTATAVPRARRTYELVRDPAVDDHLGPQRSGPATRRVFWRRLDALIAQARR